jgi:hypothetical protein
LPEVDLRDWRSRPYRERLRIMCRHWAMHGFGTPPPIFVFYIAKIGLYVAVWLYFVTRTPGIGGIGEFRQWWAEPIAFQKAVVWSLIFEVMGFGAASGPLTARYFPPVGGILYFTRPGTTRLPPWPRVPLTPGYRRNVVDVVMYLALLVLGFRALAAPEMTADVVLPLVALLPLIGLRDKTIFLAARSEHYWVTAVVFLVPGDLIAGSQAVQLALWWGAATSKLNRHFPAVITVMVSNSPVLRWQRLRRLLYRDHPDDMRPSKHATWAAHLGTAVEYSFGLILVLSSGGWPTTVGLVMMVAFHTYILTSVPMGVPVEWNVFFIYGGLVLFGANAGVSPLDIGSPLLAAFLITSLIVIPVLGNTLPSKISFLPSMRYYAGNWATSFWLFRDDCYRRLDECLTKSAPTVQRQLRRFYDDDTADALLDKAVAFRSMHLHGRALNDLAPRAVDDLERYFVHDGEWIAGITLGWNFGDGHLHHEQLLDAIQRQCWFDEGQLVCIFVESQPIQRQSHDYRIVDASAGLIESGRVPIRGLLEKQPWPDGDDHIEPDRAAETRDAGSPGHQRPVRPGRSDDDGGAAGG